MVAAVGFNRSLDPVAARLAEAGDDHAASVLAWLSGQQSRAAMGRRAFWCSLAGWSMVSGAAIAGAIVSFIFARNLQSIFGDDWLSSIRSPWVVTVLPPIFIVLAVVVVVGGISLWTLGKFPGLGATNNALDWAGTSDAVSRLLMVGCTYPEAFQTAASIANTRASRTWLSQAASRVEQGAPEVDAANANSGDAAMVELLIESSFADPSRRWRIAAEHFFDVAEHRLALLTSTVPILTTLLAGLLVWMSISASVGWMWNAAVSYLQVWS